jgi:hypothetical protein
MRSAIRNRASAFLASLIAGISSAAAAAPVSVDGWRYVEGPNELHVYVCERADCVSGSRVVCRFDAPGSAVFPGIFRKQETVVSEMLGEPSKVFSPPAVDLSTGEMHIVAMASDGSKIYYAYGSVDSSRWHASLNSSSPDQKTSRANLEQFESALEHARN